MVDSMDKGGDFLAHFGVLGMHWGVRKQPESTVGPNIRGVQIFKGKTAAQQRARGKTLGKEGAVFIGFSVAAVGAREGIKKGAKYIASHPESILKEFGIIQGSKAFTIGSKIIRLGFKDGRYV